MPEIIELKNEFKVDRESGGLDMIRRFQVKRTPSSERHMVEVRCSPDSGTPQAEWCDCHAFKFRGNCSHIKMVYDAGMLSCEIDD